MSMTHSTCAAGGACAAILDADEEEERDMFDVITPKELDALEKEIQKIQ